MSHSFDRRRFLAGCGYLTAGTALGLLTPHTALLWPGAAGAAAAPGHEERLGKLKLKLPVGPRPARPQPRGEPGPAPGAPPSGPEEENDMGRAVTFAAAALLALCGLGVRLPARPEPYPAPRVEHTRPHPRLKEERPRGRREKLS